ncbi:MAG: hydantoinase B/oxoprolinase family protein [Pseudomonadota bacterium]
MSASSADPFTLSVIQAGFEAAALEMFDTLRKTAMSPIIYEVLDVGTGVLDADGALVASGAGIPGFIGVLDKSVKAIISRERAPIVDGDVFVLNDPNAGGVTHLNDVVLAEPVFHDGMHVAWVASIGHWGDIGGKTPGSMAVDVTDICAEGLRLPPLRLFRAGQLNHAVVDIIATNSRLPDYVRGDLAAQLAAGRRGAATLRALYHRYGAQAMAEAERTGFSEGKARAIAGLKALPKGRFPMAARQDDGTVWKANIEIADESFTVDLTEAPDAARGPHNTSRDGALVVCQMLFKSLTDPERFANAGSFAPLMLLTRPGSIFDPHPTDPQGYYFETRIRLFDLLWRGMAEAMPSRLPSGHFATIFGTVMTGKHPDTGRNTAMVEPQMGGWGATSERAGTGPLFSSSHGDSYNCPVEIAEARYGLHIVERSLNLASTQKDAYAGGPGVTTRYKLRAPVLLSAGLSRSIEPVWSQGGATPSGRNALTVHRPGQTKEQYNFVSGLALDAGDEVEIRTAPGGAVKKPSPSQ